MKTKIFFLLIIFFLNAILLSAQWQWKSPYPQGNTIHKIFTGQNNSVYGIGDFGTLIYSTNTGINWHFENKFYNITEPFSSYFKFDDYTFYLVSNDGKILKSTDSGESWFMHSQIPGVSGISNIFFTSADTCYAISGQNKILKTTNGGLDWLINYSSSNSFLNTIIFVNSNTGFVSGGNGFFSGPRLLKTTDGGNNWEQLLTANSGDFFLKKFTNDSVGFGTLYNKLYKTTDQGLEWNLFPNNFSENCNDAFVFSEDSIVSVHDGNMIRFTTNGGLNWIDNSIPENSNGLYFENFNLGYVMGSNNRILSTTNKGNTWTYLTESNGSGTAATWLKKIAFVNYNTGFVCGWNSYFRKTTNKGENWITIQTGLSGHVNDLDFIDENTGYLVGGNSGFTFVAITSNGGLNFSQISSFESSSAGGIDFINHNTGFILGYYSFFRSSNSGLNWSYISLSDSIQLYGIDFIDEQTGFVSGQINSSHQNKVYKTTNSGLNWQEMFSANDVFYNIDFADNLTGYICGRGIYKTSNGGVNWIKLSGLPNNPFLAGIEFINSNTGFVCGYGDMYKTTDGGIQWQINTSLPTNVRLEEITFFGSDTGIIIGDNGIILKTYNGGGNFITGINNSNIVQQINFSLHQNYPNPFNPKTVIGYSLTGNRNVSLKVYNALGKEIVTLVNEKQNAGSYTVNFIGEGLSSGVYFYRLEAGEFVESKRMILLK